MRILWPKYKVNTLVLEVISYTSYTSCNILHFFGIGCLFIALFTTQVAIFSKIDIVYFTKQQWRRSSNRDYSQLYIPQYLPRIKINQFDISYGDLFEIYIMDTRILEAINYIRNIRESGNRQNCHLC